MRLGSHATPEQVEKNRLSHLGHPGYSHVWTGEQRKHMSAVKKGTKIGPMSDEARKNHSLSLIGHPMSEAARVALLNANVGKHRSEETKARLSAFHQGVSFSEWRGPATPEHERIRHDPSYDVWRTAVYERDDYTCQVCGKHGAALEAHHIRNFAAHKDERLDVANGVTMCAPCHKRFHLLFGQRHNTLQELQTFVMAQEA